MQHLEYARKLPYPAEAVWDLVGDFGNAEIAAGFVDRVETVGEGVGMERIFHLPERLGGGAVRERLEELDPVLRRVSYRLTDNGPLPWTGYFGTITVTPCGPAACAILAELRLTPIGIRPEEAAAISMSNMEMFFRNLAQILDGRISTRAAGALS